MAKKLIENMKTEAKLFVSNIFKNTNSSLDEKNIATLEMLLRFTTKQVLLFKTIFLFDEELDFFDSMIYSILMALKTIFSDNWFPEQHDLYIRIFIEHFIKMLANVKLESKQGTPSIIDTLKSQYNNENVKPLLDVLYSEYSHASASLHGGKSKLQNLQLYYNQLNQNNTLTNKALSKEIKRLNKILLSSIELLIIVKKDLLSKVFYNKIKVLKYLLSENLYEKYKTHFYS